MRQNDTTNPQWDESRALALLDAVVEKVEREYGGRPSRNPKAEEFAIDRIFDFIQLEDSVGFLKSLKEFQRTVQRSRS